MVSFYKNQQNQDAKHGKGRKSWLNVTNGKYNFNILLFTSCINHVEIFLHKSYKIFLIFLSKCDNFNGTD